MILNIIFQLYELRNHLYNNKNYILYFSTQNLFFFFCSLDKLSKSFLFLQSDIHLVCNSIIKNCTKQILNIDKNE